MEIVTIDNDKKNILSRKTSDVKKISIKTGMLIINMIKTVKDNGALGLAAPQVGEPLSIFVLNNDILPIDEAMIVFNPKIIGEGDGIVFGKEGCLSVPNHQVTVGRKSKIKVQYNDINMNLITEDLDGIMSIVFQHEYDHLQGKTILEYEGMYVN